MIVAHLLWCEGVALSLSVQIHYDGASLDEFGGPEMAERKQIAAAGYDDALTMMVLHSRALPVLEHTRVGRGEY